MSKVNKTNSLHGLAQEIFSSQDVTRITGVSLRQLQWWDEQGVVSPVQRGHKRLYQIHEVIEVAVINELRSKGISLQKIRRAMKFLHKEMGAGLFDAASNGRDVHLLTDGKNFFLEDNHRRIIDIFNEARQPMIAVCVSSQIRQLASVSTLKKSIKPETRTAVPSRVVRAS